MMNPNELTNIIEALIQKNMGKDVFRLGEITQLNSVGARVRFDGETVASSKYYPIMGNGLMTMVGDRVLMIRVKGSYCILGKMYSGGATTYSGFGRLYPYNINGDGIAISMGGTTIIGGGESPFTIMENIGPNYGIEELHLSADTNVTIHTGVQSGFANRNTFTFDSSGFAQMGRNKIRNSNNAYNVSTVYVSPNHFDVMLTVAVNDYITIPGGSNTAYADFTWPVAFSEAPQIAIIGGRDGNSVNANFGIYNITATGFRVYGGRLPFVNASTGYNPGFQAIAIGRKI